MVRNADWTYVEFMTTINDIRRRASLDRDFRHKCLSSPHSAIEQVAGHPYETHHVIFLDDIREAKLYTDSPNTLTFVLPELV
ncbi:hypothetical protein JD969_09650 [Planctomycetota bacterium]|nr:hypothetical protein JD969_09650 [Planctomycetota bacterium]